MFNRYNSLQFLPLLLKICLSILAVHGIGRAGIDEQPWKPVDPAHLQLKAPVVEKDADAEALFWDVLVDKGEEKAELRHYVRIKLFSQKACDEHGKVRILYSKGDNITEITGRTIKPDGQIVELGPNGIFETTAYQYGKTKTQAKTFVMPSLEPGAIIEYRWRETRKDARFLILDFQMEIPVQSVRYLIKDTSSTYAFGRMKAINIGDVRFKEEGKQMTSASRNNIPAFRPEPMMPPEATLRGWLMVYHVSAYAEYNIWSLINNEAYEENKQQIKPNDEVKRATAGLIAGATTDLEKLERIYAFCQGKIKNVNDDATMNEQARKKIAETKNPADTLRRGSGTGLQIDWLFAAMANAAGFDARIAKGGDRSERFFNKNSPFTSALESYHVAVHMGDRWRFFDPAGAYLPFGMLRWQEEGTTSLIPDPVSPQFQLPPISAPNKSKILRKATLKLGEDGSLEGDVRIEYTGHASNDRKERMQNQSPEAHSKALTDLLKARMPSAEISDIRIENVKDPVRNLTEIYHLRIPDYAQRTGKRILFQPAVFQYGQKPIFPNQTRRHPVYFHYPWSEDDDVRIELPVSFEPETISEVLPLTADTVAEYKPKMEYETGSRTLVFKRTYFFGGGGALLFPQSNDPESIQAVYKQLKTFFDLVQDRDGFTISLRMSALAAK